jgi:succinyl-diaminopimelate desuccinylase
MVVDRRMLPHETFAGVTAELTEILDAVASRHPGIDYEITYVAGNEAAETPLDSPLIAALDGAHRAVQGRPASIWGPPYGCDMRNFVCDAGIPTTNFGPGDFRVCHEPNEFVEVEDLHTCARILMVAALDLLEGEGKGPT